MNSYTPDVNPLVTAPPEIVTPNPQPTMPQFQGADLAQQIKPFYIDGLSVRTSYQIGFLAKSVVITNLTGQWFYCSILDYHIPPYMWGAVRNLPHGAQQFTLTPESPVGFSSTPIAGQTLTLVFYDVLQPPVNGAILPSANAGGPMIVARLAPITVVNSVVETDMLAYSIPANLLGTANALRTTFDFRLKNNSLAAATLQFSGYLGGVLQFRDSASIPNAATLLHMQMRMFLQNQGVVNAQTFSLEGFAGRGAPANGFGLASGAAYAFYNYSLGSTPAINTALTQTVRISLQWGTADPQIEADLLGGVVELL